MNKKLKDIGEKLDISGENLEDIEREKKREKILNLISGLILSVSMAFLTINILDKSTWSNQGYPYAAVGPITLAAADEDKIPMWIVVLIISGIVWTLGATLYMMMPKYGVFSKERDDIFDAL